MDKRVKSAFFLRKIVRLTHIANIEVFLHCENGFYFLNFKDDHDDEKVRFGRVGDPIGALLESLFLVAPSKEKYPGECFTTEDLNAAEEILTAILERLPHIKSVSFVTKTCSFLVRFSWGREEFISYTDAPFSQVVSNLYRIF